MVRIVLEHDRDLLLRLSGLAEMVGALRASTTRAAWKSGFQLERTPERQDRIVPVPEVQLDPCRSRKWRSG